MFHAQICSIRSQNVRFRLADFKLRLRHYAAGPAEDLHVAHTRFLYPSTNSRYGEGGQLAARWLSVLARWALSSVTRANVSLHRASVFSARNSFACATGLIFCVSRSNPLNSLTQCLFRLADFKLRFPAEDLPLARRRLECKGGQLATLWRCRSRPGFSFSLLRACHGSTRSGL